MKKLKYSILLFLLACSIQLKASHILGGQMWYECLGGGAYKITLKLYVTPDCTNCAQFDDLVSLGVYVCINEPDCIGLGQNNALQILMIPLKEEKVITPPVYEGFQVPSMVSIKEGTYEAIVSGLNIALPGESYYIVYQRCCRDNSLTNISEPDKSGITIYTKISELAWSECLSGSESIALPVSYACTGETVELDFTLNDHLFGEVVYVLCSPLLGGGIDGGPDAPALPINICTGLMPRPGCPPPYPPVEFYPEFSSENPMGNNQLKIDALEGIVTIEPTVIGNYLYSVCALQLHNGAVYNIHRMEQTIKVIDCLISSDDEQLPSGWQLSISPNPMNQDGRIYFNLGTGMQVRFSLYDSVGRRLGILTESTENGGSFRINDVVNQSLSSGIYLIQAEIHTASGRRYDHKRFIVY